MIVPVVSDHYIWASDQSPSSVKLTNKYSAVDIKKMTVGIKKIIIHQQNILFYPVIFLLYSQHQGWPPSKGPEYKGGPQTSI